MHCGRKVFQERSLQGQQVQFARKEASALGTHTIDRRGSLLCLP